MNSRSRGFTDRPRPYLEDHDQPMPTYMKRLLFCLAAGLAWFIAEGLFYYTLGGGK